MNIVDKYRELGSYRAAARACGVDHKTVKQVVARAERGQPDQPGRQPLRGHNYDRVADLVVRRVIETRGRITAKRLLPAVRAAGYAGSDRNLRRLVAAAKGVWAYPHSPGVINVRVAPPGEPIDPNMRWGDFPASAAATGSWDYRTSCDNTAPPQLRERILGAAYSRLVALQPAAPAS